jgi:UTP--glucose-1-phosphate uridylyltransferase
MMDCDANMMEFRSKMEHADIHPMTISLFERYYRQLVSGETGIIDERDILPLKSLPGSEDMDEYAESGIGGLSKAVVIKLNGGLGTSMGMDRTKSLLEVKKGLTFLDIIAEQIMRIRADYGANVPLLFMNSDLTRNDTLQILRKYQSLAMQDIPLDFIQSRVPKIRKKDLAPVAYPADPGLEWNPPGHGDVYYSLQISKCLESLLNKGFRYAFISNADNLGAELDPLILGYFITKKCSFLMEAAKRTSADRKGGHLAIHKDGYLVLREIAQCAEKDRNHFSNIDKHYFFNTNSIWIHLEKLRDLLIQKDGFLDLPLIRNIKTVNPRDPESEPVYQLETAMGSAISRFDHTAAIRVPRTRFLPVKTTDDLIGLWSDAYYITDRFHVRLAPECSLAPISMLDKKFYGMIDQLQAKFPYGAPSLKYCTDWLIEGDVVFEKDVVIRGSARIINHSGSTIIIPAGTVIENDLIF